MTLGSSGYTYCRGYTHLGEQRCELMRRRRRPKPNHRRRRRARRTTPLVITPWFSGRLAVCRLVFDEFRRRARGGGGGGRGGGARDGGAVVVRVLGLYVSN